MLDAQPEIIVLALCGYDMSAPRAITNCFAAFPDFDSLPAAVNNQIYVVDAGAYFARPGPRIVDSLEILAGILHPAEFPEFAPGSANLVTEMLFACCETGNVIRI